MVVRWTIRILDLEFFFFFLMVNKGYIYIYIYTRTPKESQDKAWLNTSH